MPGNKKMMKNIFTLQHVLSELGSSNLPPGVRIRQFWADFTYEKGIAIKFCLE